MNKTILLSNGTNYVSAKTNRFMWIIGAVVYIGIGISQIYRYEDEKFGFIVWSYLILGGLYLLGYSFLGLSEKSKYAPKVLLNEDYILIKKSFWKPAKQLNWNNISSIKYQSYQIDFRGNKETYTFTYDTSSATSIEIKRAIRELAENKRMQVISG